MNVPLWIWILAGVFLLLGILWFIGVRMELTTGHRGSVGAVPARVVSMV
jgi:hypothetical protein